MIGHSILFSDTREFRKPELCVSELSPNSKFTHTTDIIPYLKVLMIFFHFIELISSTTIIIYELIGKKKCNHSALYTYTGDSKCDGWRNTTLQGCKDKCSRNDVPSGCTHIVDKQCRYAQWNPSGWCHLADKTCKIINSPFHLLFQQQRGN